MNLRDAQPAAAGWQAHLELGYAAREERTILAHRRHNGPLLVQKPFYPEGARVCHSTLVHPPGGIAGGDRLQIDVAADAGAHAVITTPGATKWYRSNGDVAEHRSDLRLASEARLEWLPQASIVFDAAQAKQTHRVSLQRNARYIGWDIVCYGRIARGERFGFLRTPRAARRKLRCGSFLRALQPRDEALRRRGCVGCVSKSNRRDPRRSSDDCVHQQNRTYPRHHNSPINSFVF